MTKRNPSATKSGPGRYHKPGHRKTLGKTRFAVWFQLIAAANQRAIIKGQA